MHVCLCARICVRAHACMCLRMRAGKFFQIMLSKEKKLNHAHNIKLYKMISSDKIIIYTWHQIVLDNVITLYRKLDRY